MDIMALRIFIILILMFSILFLPFWVSLILAFIGMVSFPFFVEAIILFLLSDLLFGVSGARFSNVVVVSMLISIAMFIAVEIFKTKSVFYHTKLK
jgi:hypothetical protein